jgi:hypothetical protein
MALNDLVEAADKVGLSSLIGVRVAAARSSAIIFQLPCDLHIMFCDILLCQVDKVCERSVNGWRPRLGGRYRKAKRTPGR